MIIKAFELEKLKKVNENFLLYGDNEGLKNQVFEEFLLMIQKEKYSVLMKMKS